MKITDVRIRKMDSGGKMKAVASVTFDEEFVVHDIKIVEGEKGYFIAMPSKRVGEAYKDVAHPLSAATRKKISDAIFEKYYEEDEDSPAEVQAEDAEESAETQETP